MRQLCQDCQDMHMPSYFAIPVSIPVYLDLYSDLHSKLQNLNDAACLVDLAKELSDSKNSVRMMGDPIR